MENETIDIPLPDDPSSPSGGDAPQTEENASTASSTNTSNPTMIVPQMNASQLYHQQYYHAYYAAYHQTPHPQFQYYVPVVPPVVPVMPMPQQTPMNTMTTAEEAEDEGEDDDEDDDDDPTIAKTGSTTKASNILPIHCNEKMHLNPLIYQNIQQSPYFKNNLFLLKTYHEVIDEIYYNVKHLEPWEQGSRKVGGQTGMCGSVRGVGAGGIISTPFCILYKLFTLKLTRKQVNGLIRHKDSPYIRSLGFMYIRFTQPPAHLWQWFEPFLEDEEEVDPKAGGGQVMTIGQMCRHMLTKLDWFSTLFPRVPVPIQKDIETKLKQWDSERENEIRAERGIEEGEVEEEEGEEDDRNNRRHINVRRRSDSRERRKHTRSRSRSRSREKRKRSRSTEKRSRSRERRSRSRDRHRHRRSKSRSPSHRHSRGDNRDRERDHHRHKNRY